MSSTLLKSNIFKSSKSSEKVPDLSIKEKRKNNNSVTVGKTQEAVKVEGSKTEARNKLSHKKTEETKINANNGQKSEKNSKSSSKLSIEKGIKDKKGRSLTKVNSNEEPVKNMRRIAESNYKVEQPEKEAMIERNYKDLIYFEVDMGDVRPSSKTRSRSARIKSSTVTPPAISRQGTFTKDDSPTRPESIAPTFEQKPVEIEGDDEVEYEDDFEDYESDFEEYVTSESESESGLSSKTETDSEAARIVSLKKMEILPESVSGKVLNMKVVEEEEKKLDSGSYDLSSKPVFSQSIKKKQLDQIKEAISNENTALFDKRRKEIFPEKTDEKENKTFILDFVGALRKKQEAEKIKRKKQRSAQIVKMINLYEWNIHLFDEIFLDDDFYIDMYQKRNVVHASTGMDLILIEEETQTNEIKLQNKWTQHPIGSQLSTSFNLKTFLEDQRGCGGDIVKVDNSSWKEVNYDAKSLYNFIASASKVILVMLEEETRWKSKEQSFSVENSKNELSFSEGFIPLHVHNVEFLKDRPICDVLFSPHDSNILLSSHRFSQDIEKLPSFADQFLGRSIICIWSSLEPSQPLHMLVASCQVCAVSFDLEYRNFIYAGLTDGSVCLWDLNESSIYHKETTAGSMGFLLRTPTSSTSHLSGEEYHQNIIVSIKSLGFERIGKTLSQRFHPTQIVTLDADGKVIFWIVTPIISNLERAEKNDGNFDLGVSFWGKFKLVKGRALDLENILPGSDDKWSLQFHCMSMAPDFESAERKYSKSILVGTNIAKIIHFYSPEDALDVPVFFDESEDYTFSVICLEKNPHGFPIFLAGCSDGRIRFYALDKPNPFKSITLHEKFVDVPIIKINWSPLGLGLFLALDKNFSLHFWDICKSFDSPQTSVSLKSLQAAHFDVACDQKFVFIVMSVHRVKINVYSLKEKFVCIDSDEEKTFFVRFVKSNSKLLG